MGEQGLGDFLPVVGQEVGRGGGGAGGEEGGREEGAVVFFFVFCLVASPSLAVLAVAVGLAWVRRVGARGGRGWWGEGGGVGFGFVQDDFGEGVGV